LHFESISVTCARIDLEQYCNGNCFVWVEKEKYYLFTNVICIN